MNISNTEKQARFRKKEALRRYADKIFREWQVRAWNLGTRTPEVARAFLDKVADFIFHSDFEGTISQINLSSSFPWRFE